MPHKGIGMHRSNANSAIGFNYFVIDFCEQGSCSPEDISGTQWSAMKQQPCCRAEQTWWPLALLHCNGHGSCWAEFTLTTMRPERTTEDLQSLNSSSTGQCNNANVKIECQSPMQKHVPFASRTRPGPLRAWASRQQPPRSLCNAEQLSELDQIDVLVPPFHSFDPNDMPASFSLEPFTWLSSMIMSEARGSEEGQWVVCWRLGSTSKKRARCLGKG